MAANRRTFLYLAGPLCSRMSRIETPPRRLEPEPLAGNISSIQPGGGVCYRIELAWGVWRRWYLRTCRPGYVGRMAALRQGSTEGCPHEVIDSRDVKFFRNRCDARWSEEDDPFAWRGRLPFTRWGLAELVLLGSPLFLVTLALALTPWWYISPLAAVPLGLVIWFFRDPTRSVPSEAGMIVSAADGKVVDITELADDAFIGGPAVRIGVFLSIFNVHVNRAPARCRVIELRYSPGKFLNALRPESAEQNENMWIGLEEEAPPLRRFTVRQISGAVARRIVCDLRPGQVVDRGERFGMIKLGSRTEIILPLEDGLQILVKKGQHVQGGKSVLAKYPPSRPDTSEHLAE